MKEARRANTRSLLLSALVLSSSAFQAQAYYHPDEGRWLSRDPIGERGGYNNYVFVFNEPVTFVDKIGLDIFVAPKPTTITKCSGVCGADITDWFKDEVKSQKDGWDKYKASVASPGYVQYVWFAYHNQFYKPTKGTGGWFQPPAPNMPASFVFNKGVKNSQGHQCGEGSCGTSVTLCGQCIHSSVLGNLMFGMIAKYAGQDLNEITKYVNGLKSGAWQTPDPYDAPVYKVGFDVFASFDFKDDLTGGGAFCTKLLASAQAQSVSLQWLGNGSASVISRESCRPCDAKTTATQHGGGFKVTIPK